MPWIEKKPKSDKPHRCRTPRLWPWTRVGATWMCDECEWIWVVERIPDPASGGSYKVWKLSDSRTQYQRSWDNAEDMRKRMAAINQQRREKFKKGEVDGVQPRGELPPE